MGKDVREERVTVCIDPYRAPDGSMAARVLTADNWVVGKDNGHLYVRKGADIVAQFKDWAWVEHTRPATDVAKTKVGEW